MGLCGDVFVCVHVPVELLTSSILLCTINKVGFYVTHYKAFNFHIVDIEQNSFVISAGAYFEQDYVVKK